MKNKRKIHIFLMTMFVFLFISSSVITILNIINNELDLIYINIIAIICNSYCITDEWFKLKEK